MKKYLVLLVTFYSCHSIYCQNIGIGTNNPQNKLHIAGGLRIDTLANSTGLLQHSFNGAVSSLAFTGGLTDVLRGNGTWGPVFSTGWSLTGNSGTNPSTNFLGTTDNQPLYFKVNNQIAGLIHQTNSNTSFGLLSLTANTGQKNTVVGSQILNFNTTGSWNTASGYQSLRANTTGMFNSAYGAGALYSNQIGGGNTGSGVDALVGNTEGSGNTAFGNEALFSNATGSFNTSIGYQSDVLSGTLTNATALGANARVDCNNCLVLGSVNGINNAFSGVNVGIGTTNPQNKLHVAGGLRVDTLSNGIDSGLVRHDKFGVAYSLKFTGNAADVLRGNGSFGPIVSSGNWSLAGNSGTNPSTNFIGTTDAQPLKFKINNISTGELNPITGNIFFGLRTGQLNTTGYSNIGIGTDALKINETGSNNVAIGDSALFNNGNVSIGGFKNTAVGSKALYSNTSGYDNTANGYAALAFNTTGQANTAMGHLSLNQNQTGSGNTAIGSSALRLTTGGDNSAIGANALQLNQNGVTNTATGSNALFSNQQGNSNTASGYNSLLLNTNGSSNSVFGAFAFNNNLTGSQNTALGFAADVLSSNLSNATAIGANAKVGSSNSMVLGSAGVNVGIGVSSPIVTLHVKGSANIFSGADTHTGDFYSGTSNVDGIEMVSSGSDAYMSVQRTSNYGLHISKKNISSNSGLAGFFVNGVNVGSITTNGVNTSFNTTSDSRLKENILPTHYGLITLMKLSVADYNYKANGKKTLQTGFLAQELYEVYPQAVHVGGENEKIDPWMIDYSKITPLLVKSIQEQQQQIESQRNDIEFLKLQVAELNIAIKKLTR